MHIAAPGKIPEYPMQFVSNNGSNCQGITHIYIYVYMYPREHWKHLPSPPFPPYGKQKSGIVSPGTRCPTKRVFRVLKHAFETSARFERLGGGEMWNTIDVGWIFPSRCGGTHEITLYARCYWIIGERNGIVENGGAGKAYQKRWSARVHSAAKSLKKGGKKRGDEGGERRMGCKPFRREEYIVDTNYFVREPLLEHFTEHLCFSRVIAHLAQIFSASW